MKIQKILGWVMVAGLGTIGAGCSDWLDVQPKDKQTEEQLFATMEGFNSAVNGIYVSLGSDALYGKNLSYEMLDILGKRYQVNSKQDYFTQLNAYNYSEKTVADQIQATWEKAYKVILNCNVILKNLEERRENVVNEANYKLLRGELLGVRAFLHFDMLRMFGPVYKMDPQAESIPYNESASGEALPLLPADSVIHFKIMRDLTEAESLLENSDPVIAEGVLDSTRYEDPDNSMRYRQLRFNYYAVRLLKARVLLYAEKPLEALEAALKIIEDPVANEHFPAVDPTRLLANALTPDRMFSTECLLGLYNKDRNLIYRDRFNGESAGDNLLQPREGFVDGSLFAGENQDYRFQSQWIQSATVGSPGLMLIKYRGIEDPDNDYFHGTFVSLMKISEAWYIAAEAETDLNKAYEYLNDMRKRRGLQDLPVADKNQLMSRLRLEYIREFIGEGQVFFMYKRMYREIVASENGYNTSVFAASTARYVLPLPESEIENR